MTIFKEITVSKKIFSKYKTNTEAIEVAEKGTKIFVEPGIYEESLVINKEVEIIGKGNVNEIIVRSTDSSTITMQTSKAKVCELTIMQIGRNHEGNEGCYAIDLSQGSLIIEGCRITSTIGNGILISNSHTEPILLNCSVYNCKRTAICIIEGGNPTIQNCKIHNNMGMGIMVIDKGKGIIEYCEIHSNNQTNVGIATEGSPLFNSCDIYESKENGVWVNKRGQGTFESCKIYKNNYPNIGIVEWGNPLFKSCQVYEGHQNGVWVKGKGQGTFKNCEVYKNTSSNVFVDTEGNPLFNSSNIYEGKASGVWVEEKGQGTFESCEIYKNNHSNVGIKTEGNPFFKSCHVYESQQCGVWVKEKGQGTFESCEIYKNNYSNVEIETEGNPLFNSCNIYEGKASGVWVEEKGQGAFESCEIYKNNYSNIGIKTEGNPFFKSCRIYESQQYGVWVKEKGQGRFESCEIHKNNYSNIGIKTEGNSLFKSCRIYESQQYGVWVEEKGQGAFEGCEIYKNNYSNIGIKTEGNSLFKSCRIYETQQYGVWVEEKGQGTFESCEIHKNNYSNIGVKTEGNSLFKSCRIYESQQYGVWVEEKGQGTFKNCEVYKNTRSNVFIYTEGSPLFDSCNIYGGKASGVWVKEKGEGTFESCEIYKNNYSNVGIETEGNPLFKSCRIYESQQCGVWVKEKGQGAFESCKIHQNNDSNIAIETEGDPSFSNCEIYNSQESGLFVEQQGKGTIKNCNFYGNNKSNIIISEDSDVNIENAVEQTENDSSKQREEASGSSSAKIDNNVSLEEVLNELNILIGMNNIKEQIRKTIQYVQFNQELVKFGVKSKEVQLAVSHTVLYGNPGTGKTTVAKLLGKLYKAMGVLSSGHVVQVNREKLVGEYIGHTAPKTKKVIDEALGGVLFIDEAYELSNKGSENDFGPEAIALILEEMENRKGDFIVVVAGYEKEMLNFLEINPGLKSRFTQYFNLQDYIPDELVEIAKKIANDNGRKLSVEAVDLLHKEFTMLWRKRDRYFSNARTVRNYVEAMLQEQPQRCMKSPKDQWTTEFLETLTSEDVRAVLLKEEVKTFDLSINEELLSQALQQLNRMIGMDQVKYEIEKLVTLVRFYKEEQRNLQELSPHTLLIGSPGTGKTEVARIIAKIYEALGILERGDLVEVNRDKLVRAHTGESEKIITRYVDQAMGGTLFIDEAYQLTQYGPDDPGHKVIEVLLKRMEDERGRFIVIVAGYKEHMGNFLDSNDGLRRRFVRHIEFEDYTPIELIQISELILQEKGYILDVQAEEALSNYFKLSYENRDQTFGNAGFVRNIISESIKNADYRVAKIPRAERTEQVKRTILAEDVYLTT
ncbi:right-handed parallel beta-helix repeat-containing protein [Priestia aryabhattai]|uniref:right-handed parallel beta-helix repeat-containing protein n=1 Tax=Priestia aryabhattai TaxID=412384 RepID=UPI00068DF8A4|nr:right-handed parallel beta-helix repeat-containing protein [Priestia aryabhattai]